MDDSFCEAFLKKNLIYFNTFDGSADEWKLIELFFMRKKSVARTQMLHQNVFCRGISRHFNILYITLCISL